MNHQVPYFDMDEFYTAPASVQSGYKNMHEDEITELVWHNGHPEVQNHRQRVFRKSSPPLKSDEEQLLNQPPLHPMAPPPQPETTSATQLFIQEDEMTAWLHYPLDNDTSFDRNLTDLLCHPPGPPAAPQPSSVAPSRAISPAELRPPPALAQHPHHPVLQTRHQSRPPAPAAAVGVNFPHFARLRPRFPEAGQSASSRNNEPRESAVVDSNVTPKSSFLLESNSVVKISCGGSQGDETVGGSRSIEGTSTAGCSRDYTTMISDSDTYNLTLTSFGGSFSGASATATADLITQPPADDRKRKGMEPAAAVNTENQSEDLEIESSEAMKQYPGTASGKRSRATEVHNLSERKRRDRINEKMKALQDLIPRCSKRNQTDKASMLDEAIDYLKSLQLQVQMMSVGYYGMVPMMFPGVQQFMPVPPIGVGTGMETGMSRPPMVPFPGAPSALGPRFTFPSFPTSPIPAFDPSTVQRNQMELAANPHGAPVANFVTMPTSADLYQQYLASLQMPGASENQSASTVDTGQPSTSKEAER